MDIKYINFFLNFNVYNMIKNIKKSISEENREKLVVLFAVIVFVWIIYFLIPSVFVLLFTTFLGKIMLLLSIILVSIKDFSYGIILAIVLIVFERFSYLSSKQKDGFWGMTKENDFLKMQRTVNRNTVFLMDEIMKQATKKEADYYLANGFWPWDKKTEELYMAASLNNGLIQTSTKDSMNDAKTKYNQRAILEILADQAKEGKFMSKGILVPTGKNAVADGTGSFGYNAGLMSNLYNKNIKCHPKNKNSKEYVLKSLEYKGDEGILGTPVWETKKLDINDLENIIPGFTFLKGPCNPCAAVHYENKPSYHCPFSLKLKNDSTSGGGVSEVWKHLWKLGDQKLNKNTLYSKEEIDYEITAHEFKLPSFNT